MILSRLAGLRRVSNYAIQTINQRRWVSLAEPEPMSSKLVNLERTFSRFEEKCQRAERVMERDFARTFDYMARTVSTLEQSNALSEDERLNISLSAATLLRCCGKLMTDTPEKHRELMAGNLWQFMKEKKIPLDISHYNSLLRVLNENKTNYDPQKLLDEIHSLKLNPDRITYQRLIHQYCLQGDISGATTLLEKMKELGMELNEMTFSSLIIGYSKQENPPSVCEMFDLMKSNGVEPGERSIAAALVALAQNQSKNPKAEEDLKTILAMIQSDDVNFGDYEAIDLFCNLAPLKSNEVVSEIIELITRPLAKNFTTRNKVILGLVKNNNHEFASELYWRFKPSERAIEGGIVGTPYVKALAMYKHVPVDHAIQECTKLKNLGYNSKPFHILYYTAAEHGQLDLVRAALKKVAEDEPVKCQYYWPLLAQAKTQDDIIHVLKNDLSPKMNTNDLLDTFSQWVWPRFADNTKKLFEMNAELQYDNNVLVATFLNYSVQENKIMEAIKFISEAPESLIGKPSEAAEAEHEEDDGDMDHDPVVNPRLANRTDRTNIIGRLLDQVAEQTKDPELVKKAFSLCQAPGQPLSSRTAAPLVKVYLLNDDFKGAMEIFLKLAEEHRISPYSRQLMTKCLTAKDPENLQKIMNVLTDFNGEGNSLFDLATCCLQSGKLKQAQKIFTSPGFRVRSVRVYQMCRYFAKLSDISALENFVNLTRGMYDINQEYLYQVLLDAYERTSNGKRALNLWNVMQEEEFQPSKKSLLLIARVLEKNNIEVPFQKPRMSSN